MTTQQQSEQPGEKNGREKSLSIAATLD